ncbi:hypothetical protein [Labrys monachus]|uniref:DUF3035 domain-containing protein n=1 Tax=Labrys monachus TaxID=217067 RepID=A0ABU0FHG0_9HYPH|nr:hypothetical protein [Labrys monachus]MDQ0393782.1 hypothetical protein [Labrys monachus]
MRILSIVVAVVAGSGLAGCAATSRDTAHTFGLTSGPLPQPQPFIVDSRPAGSKVYPIVGTTPPARSDRVLSMEQRKALESSLLATPGRQATPAKPAGKKHKKAPAGKHKPVPAAD